MATSATTDAAFESDVLQSDTPVVVDFWAEWCGPCKMIAPSLEEISSEMGERVKVMKINIDDNPGTPGKYGVRGIPTLMTSRMESSRLPRSARRRKVRCSNGLKSTSNGRRDSL